MSRPDPMRAALALALPLAMLAGAAAAEAQTGPLPPPAPVAVRQSEPGYGPLTERRGALVDRQSAINKHRDDHNAVCLGIPADNASQIAWCRADVDTIGREKTAYAQQLKAYDANQLYYQGQTRYLRKDYTGAVAYYQRAMSFGVPIDNLMPEYYLSQARVAAQSGDMERARSLMCDIDAHEANRPSWLSAELGQLFGQIKSWLMRYGKRFEVRTPTCAVAVRG